MNAIAPIGAFRPLHPGMGSAVAERTVLRKLPVVRHITLRGNWGESDTENLTAAVVEQATLEGWEGKIPAEPKITVFATGTETVVAVETTDKSFETWGDVAKRVAIGNASLVPQPAGTNKHNFLDEYTALRRLISKAALLLSGRHLQHGDADQPNRNMEVFTNCGCAETKFATQEHGITTLGERVGETVTVRCADGVWRKAKVNAHGAQQLYRLVFERVGPGPKTYQEEVFTRDHRWLLADGTVTEHIKEGDVLLPSVEHEDYDPHAVIHGAMFGDGSAHKRRNDGAVPLRQQGREYGMIRVCKQDKLQEQFHAIFDAAGYGFSTPAHAKGDRVYYVGKFPGLKEVPFTRDPSYVAGFIHGWWMADGTKDEPNGTKVINTTDEDAAQWLLSHAVFAGLTVVSHRVLHPENRSNGSYSNAKPLHIIRLRSGVKWRLSSITELDERPVYCVEEPVTKSFTLANGLVTGNCSTSPVRFGLFMLLLNGSGVGTAYDDDMCLTDWNNAPNLRVVISASHPDFDWERDEDVRDARHKYVGQDVIWHEVADTREGWAKAIELWETLAFQRIHKDKTLVLDFSKVRPRGAPIKGMQNRPSSGPKPLMAALMKCATIKGSGMRPWMQAMYMDHYLAECVLVGGARRSARMATKWWEDEGVLDFIQIKRPVEYQGLSMEEVIALRKSRADAGLPALNSFLWSANNSVMVDREFWDLVHRAAELVDGGKGLASMGRKMRHAWKVWTALTECSYADGTGEPGIINADMLVQKDDGWEEMVKTCFVGSMKYQVDEDTQFYLSRLAKAAIAKPWHMITNPCGEIALTILGGYCVIADMVPFFADDLYEALECARVTTRALIRTNLMNSFYDPEVRRTNRIGVGLTGVHEFAWKFFEIGFRDAINPDFRAYNSFYPKNTWDTARTDSNVRVRSAAFWMFLSHMSNVVVDESRAYSEQLGVNAPHTALTIKPAGTTSKLFGLTEGWHLPAMLEYLRWVQFRHDDPLVAEYAAKGYSTRELKQYKGTVIVGFPTKPTICDLGIPREKLVTAGEATPAEQYAWLRLGEQFWIDGQTDPENSSSGHGCGNQISYTLKYQPDLVSFEEFSEMLMRHQPTVRACSVMPQIDGVAFEYQPEEPVTKGRFEELTQAIIAEMAEDIGKEHLDCSTGACPTDFRLEKV